MIFSECEVPSPMFPASVSTAHRWLSRLLCFSAHLVFLVPLVGVALCLELKVSLPNAEEKKTKCNQGVQSLEMKSKIAIPKCLPSATKKMKETDNNKSGVQCIGVVSHVASIRTRTHVAWVLGIELFLPGFAAMFSAVCVV